MPGSVAHDDEAREMLLNPDEWRGILEQRNGKRVVLDGRGSARRTSDELFSAALAAGTLALYVVKVFLIRRKGRLWFPGRRTFVSERICALAIAEVVPAVPAISDIVFYSRSFIPLPLVRPLTHSAYFVARFVETPLWVLMDSRPFPPAIGTSGMLLMLIMPSSKLAEIGKVIGLRLIRVQPIGRLLSTWGKLAAENYAKERVEENITGAQLAVSDAWHSLHGSLSNDARERIHDVENELRDVILSIHSGLLRASDMAKSTLLSLYTRGWHEAVNTADKICVPDESDILSQGINRALSCPDQNDVHNCTTQGRDAYICSPQAQVPIFQHKLSFEPSLCTKFVRKVTLFVHSGLPSLAYGAVPLPQQFSFYSSLMAIFPSVRDGVLFPSVYILSAPFLSLLLGTIIWWKTYCPFLWSFLYGVIACIFCMVGRVLSIYVLKVLTLPNAISRWEGNGSRKGWVLLQRHFQPMNRGRKVQELRASFPEWMMWHFLNPQLEGFIMACGGSLERAKKLAMDNYSWQSKFDFMTERELRAYHQLIFRHDHSGPGMDGSGPMGSERRGRSPCLYIRLGRAIHELGGDTKAQERFIRALVSHIHIFSLKLYTQLQEGINSDEKRGPHGDSGFSSTVVSAAIPSRRRRRRSSHIPNAGIFRFPLERFRLTCIIDVSEVSLITFPVRTLLHTILMLERNYPGIAGNVYVVNMELMLRSTVKIILSSVSSKSANRVRMFGTEFEEDLRRRIGPSLHVAYGGECECDMCLFVVPKSERVAQKRAWVGAVKSLITFKSFEAYKARRQMVLEAKKRKARIRSDWKVELQRVFWTFIFLPIVYIMSRSHGLLHIAVYLLRANKLVIRHLILTTKAWWAHCICNRKGDIVRTSFGESLYVDVNHSTALTRAVEDTSSPGLKNRIALNSSLSPLQVDVFNAKGMTETCVQVRNPAVMAVVFTSEDLELVGLHLEQHVCSNDRGNVIDLYLVKSLLTGCRVDSRHLDIVKAEIESLAVVKAQSARGMKTRQGKLQRAWIASRALTLTKVWSSSGIKRWKMDEASQLDAQMLHSGDETSQRSFPNIFGEKDSLHSYRKTVASVTYEVVINLFILLTGNTLTR